MADRFYSLDKGETEFQITEGSATSSEDVEIRIDLSVVREKAQVLDQIDMIKNHIIKGNWPPA